MISCLSMKLLPSNVRLQSIPLHLYWNTIGRSKPWRHYIPWNCKAQPHIIRCGIQASADDSPNAMCTGERTLPMLHLAFLSGLTLHLGYIRSQMWNPPWQPMHMALQQMWHGPYTWVRNNSTLLADRTPTTKCYALVHCILERLLLMCASIFHR